MVHQLRAELGTWHGTVRRWGDQLGIVIESLRSWVEQAEVDAGEAPGTTTADAERIKTLEQENRELRPPSEPADSEVRVGFFAAELDRPQK